MAALAHASTMAPVRASKEAAVEFMLKEANGSPTGKIVELSEAEE